MVQEQVLVPRELLESVPQVQPPRQPTLLQLAPPEPQLPARQSSTRLLLAVCLASPLLGDLLLAGDRHTLALTCTGIRVSPLATHR